MFQKKAFTLIELLLVIGIIAILAGIIILAINPTLQLRKAEDSRRLSMARNIKSAVLQYQIDHGFVPTGITSVATDICAYGSTSTGCTNLDVLVDEDYIITLDRDVLETNTDHIGYTVHQEVGGFIQVTARYIGISGGSTSSSGGTVYAALSITSPAPNSSVVAPYITGNGTTANADIKVYNGGTLIAHTKVGPAPDLVWEARVVTGATGSILFTINEEVASVITAQSQLTLNVGSYLGACTVPGYFGLNNTDNYGVHLTQNGLIHVDTEGYMFAGSHTLRGVSINALSVMTQMQQISSAVLFAGSDDLFVLGNRAYVPASFRNSMHIYDISNLSAMTLLATIIDGATASSNVGTRLGGATAVAVSGNYAFINSPYDNAFSVVDISNPSSMQEVATLTNAYFGTDINNELFIFGNYVYIVSYQYDRLTIVDISNPLAPTITGTITDTRLNGASNVYVAQGRAYITAAANSSLTIVDISNPTAPSIIQTITGIGDGKGIMAAGKYLYVGIVSGRRMIVYDISNPSNAVQVASVATTQMIHDMSIRGNIIAITGYNGDLNLINVSNCTLPHGLN